jgi:hypothetical protein
MSNVRIVHWLAEKFSAIEPTLNECSRRRWAAVESVSLGRGGVTAVARATGLSRTTIHQGIRELRGGKHAAPGRVRRAGGGRKRLVDTDPGLQSALEVLIEDSTRGDPRSPLRWTCKSCRNLADELNGQGHPVAFRTVSSLLRAAGYSLQSNRKTREGLSHPDRDAQFRHISQQARIFQRRGQPVISVDGKKKEIVGQYKNAGREWRRRGQPVEVAIHDFPDPAKGRAIPYGVYDLTNNEGWVSVGLDHDTAEFASEAIWRWWRQMGSKRFPRARELMITADSGGSNGSRNRLWKIALQRLAERTGLALSVNHFPPGTSKWNKIEHRLFCHITRNWRGQPLTSYQVIVSLIAGTRTTTGLRVKARLDPKQYESGIKVTDAELGQVRLVPAKFHGEWNYSILPKR